MPNSLKLLSFNLGLAHLPPMMEAADISHRLQEMPAALLALDADVVALQEAFLPAHRHRLVTALGRSYPYALAPPRRYSVLGSGLMFLSRIPIRAGGFARVPRLGMVEHGTLWIELERPAPVRVANVHVRAGSERRHLADVDRLLGVAGRAAVLIGDFNCGPSVRVASYARVLDAGFRDAYAASGAPEAPTWDARNPLNRVGRFRLDPSQRIDHVFVPQHGAAHVAGAEIVLDDRARPLSDHYGILVRLEFDEAGTGADAARPRTLAGAQSAS